MVQLKQVIVTDNETTGKGVQGDPIRGVVKVFETNGTLIAYRDEYSEYAPGDFIGFFYWCKEKDIKTPTHNDFYSWRFGVEPKNDQE